MKGKLLNVLCLLSCFALCAGYAYAQTDAGLIGPPAPTFDQKVELDPAGAAGEAVDAVTDGNWKLAAAYGIAFLMLVANALWRNRKHEGFWATKRGGAVLVMLLSLLGAFASGIATGAPFGRTMLAGVIVAWLAAGQRTWWKALLFGDDGPDGAEA